jgi:hypothetical protein
MSSLDATARVLSVFTGQAGSMHCAKWALGPWSICAMRETGVVAIVPDLALASACCGAGKLQDDKLKRIVSAEAHAMAI